MTDVSISLSPSGRDSTRLAANVGNDLLVSWHLTDEQLMYLAAEAVRIIKNRAQNGILKASGMEEIILEALKKIR